MLSRAVVCAAFVGLCACATTQPFAVTQHPSQPLGPPVLAFVDTGGPERSIPLGRFREALGSRLTTAGFDVRRFAKDDVPFAVEIRWRSVGECSDGGFQFDDLDIGVIDLKANRTVWRARGAAATEDCAFYDSATGRSTRGHLYSDVSDALASAFGLARSARR